MKKLLKAYETLSIVFMFGFLIIFLMAITEGSMDTAVGMLLLSFIFILTTSWTHSATYINWKNKKGYEKI